MMFGDVARHMMKLMGKEPAARGIILVENLSAAIAKLKAAIGDDTQLNLQLAAAGRASSFVSDTQRALPLIQLLEWSLRRKVPVVWGT